MKKLVIFDLDGTVIDSKEVYIEVLDRVLRKKGVEKEEFIPLLGLTTEEILEELGIHQRYFSKLRAEINKLLLTSEFIQKIKAVISPELLKEIKHNRKTAIITNSDKVFVEHILRELGLYDLFDHLLCADFHVKSKADRIIFLLGSLKLTAAEAIFIGDIPSDVLAAKSANVTSVAIYNKHSFQFGNFSSIKEVMPDNIISHFDEILELLQ